MRPPGAAAPLAPARGWPRCCSRVAATPRPARSRSHSRSRCALAARGRLERGFVEMRRDALAGMARVNAADDGPDCLVARYRYAEVARLAHERAVQGFDLRAPAACHMLQHR